MAIHTDAEAPTASEQDFEKGFDKDFEHDVSATQRYFDSPRFDGITRLYSARQVVEQRGTIPADYTVAREAAEAFYPRLRELFAERKSITTFGPYSPGQAVTMKRMGIEGIYLGGWATSAKGSISEDPGPDLASYPLSQVPDEAAGPGPRPADRRPQSAVPAPADERRATRTDTGGRLPAVHHRRRRHRPRRRSARAQPDPPLRRGRRARIPHRGPAPRHQEVRTSGRQGSGAVRRTDQASQHRPLPARHHAGAGHHRRAHRCRGGQPARQSRRRARPAVPARHHQPEDPVLQILLPGDGAALLRRGVQGTQRAPAVRPPRRRIRHCGRLVGASRHRGADHQGGRGPRPRPGSRSTPSSTRSSRSSSTPGRTTPG